VIEKQHIIHNGLSPLKKGHTGNKNPEVKKDDKKAGKNATNPVVANLL
jgi:hypothetical protein